MSPNSRQQPTIATSSTLLTGGQHGRRTRATHGYTLVMRRSRADGTQRSRLQLQFQLQFTAVRAGRSREDQSRTLVLAEPIWTAATRAANAVRVHPFRVPIPEPPQVTDRSPNIRGRGLLVARAKVAVGLIADP